MNSGRRTRGRACATRESDVGEPYCGRVDGISGLVGGLIGLLVGVAATAAFRFSERAQRRLPEQPPPELDDGLVRELAVLRSAAVVMDGDDRVVRASPPAQALGLVRDGRLVHPAIRDMVAEVRRDGVIADAELELPRGNASAASPTVVEWTASAASWAASSACSSASPRRPRSG